MFAEEGRKMKNKETHINRRPKESEKKEIFMYEHKDKMYRTKTCDTIVNNC